LSGVMAGQTENAKRLRLERFTCCATTCPEQHADKPAKRKLAKEA
jgi:hypothetical protein